MNTPERWRRVQELFDAAADLVGAQQQRFLEQACPDDAALRAEVATLVEAERRSGGDAFLTGVIAAAAGDLAAENAASWVGRQVGPYRLLGELARGGMGTVYSAERADTAYQARVAIKFMRGAVAGSELVRRFLAERQILANLAHPNIARLLDGGATDDGTPYLVMEQIDGLPINSYCDAKGLDARGRLDLFRQVCDAVHYAHRHLVVHRDIKPSNILVTADGTPKLLDFGVAKLIDPSQVEPMLDTGVGGRLLTPAYASPEQVRGDPITTATDVYSLGVLLYRLLTGTLPYGAGALKEHQLAQAILTREPEAPSRLLARERGAGAPDRDLDAIVLMALEKDPARRYSSVEQLSADVGRYLDGRPVQARPATRAYRVRKFVARNRRSVLAGAAALTVMLGLTAFYIARLARERDFAAAEQRKSAEVARFLERLFRVSDPEQARGRALTAREVVDSAVARLPAELAGQPEVRAAMWYTLGGVYLNLGLSREALPLLRRGLALRRASPDPGSPTVGDFLSRLAETVLDLGQFDSASVLAREAAARLDAEYTTKDPAVRARVLLANAHRRAGRVAAADSALTRAIADARADPGDSLLPMTLSARAALYLSQRRPAEAEPVVREAWQRYSALEGPDAPNTIAALNNLGQTLYQQTRFAEAEPIIRRVLALRERVSGPLHPQTATAWNNLAALLQAEGRHQEAVATERRALAAYRASYGERHQRVAGALINLASMLLAAGQPAEAERLDREALQIDRQVLPPGHIDIATVYNNLGHVLEEQHRYAEAEQSYRQALQTIGQGIGVQSLPGSQFLANLGGVQQKRGRITQAETSLRRALAIQRDILPAQHASTATTLSTLGDLLTRAGRAPEAEPLLREALATRRALLPPDHWAIQVTRSILGSCLAALGRAAEADSLLTTSAKALSQKVGAGDERARLARERVDRFHRGEGSQGGPR